MRLVAKEVLSWPMRALHTLALWQRRWESRHRLAHLEDRLHRDAGLTQAAILAETGKPFWTA
ncbi:MAG: hypothetical protein ISR51_07255 [Rhodospirillales bacterium]|nr:hypothetical protein [Alphaproteobacteria bacterium]MBL6948459.1 hypothetical protein [Rhodospirillales bacterium]